MDYIHFLVKDHQNRDGFLTFKYIYLSYMKIANYSVTEHSDLPLFRQIFAAVIMTVLSVPLSVVLFLIRGIIVI